MRLLRLELAIGLESQSMIPASSKLYVVQPKKDLFVSGRDV